MEKQKRKKELIIKIETTGLDLDNDDVIRILLIDVKKTGFNSVVFDQYVYTEKENPAAAYNVNKIRNESIQNASEFKWHYEQLKEIIENNKIIFWSEFELIAFLKLFDKHNLKVFKFHDNVLLLQDEITKRFFDCSFSVSLKNSFDLLINVNNIKQKDIFFYKNAFYTKAIKIKYLFNETRKLGVKYKFWGRS